MLVSLYTRPFAKRTALRQVRRACLAIGSLHSVQTRLFGSVQTRPVPANEIAPFDFHFAMRMPMTTAALVFGTATAAQAMPPLSLRQRLRTETAAAHQQLEQAPLLSELASGGIGARRYTHYLRRMQVFHRALDSALLPQLPTGYLHAGLNQSAALDRDLAALQAQPAHLPAALASAAHALVGSSSAAWGVLYVLEGARLGSQVLLKRNANNSTVAIAHAFIRGEAEDTGRAWRSFCTALESGVAPADVGSTLAAAKQTFQLLGHWLAPRNLS